jgi:hypothetical protein
MRFENKNVFFYFGKRSTLCNTTLALYEGVNLEDVGLAPGMAAWSSSIALTAEIRVFGSWDRVKEEYV